MKNTLLILICAAILAACNKNQVVPTTVTITSSAPTDTFTLTDNGVTYIDTESFQQGGTGASIGIQDLSGSGLLSITAFPHAHFPIELDLQYVPGPEGSGLFTTPVFGISNSCSLEEVFNGGEAYIVDSVAIDLTTVSQQILTGTYELWLSNSAGSKTVSGVIKYHNR